MKHRPMTQAEKDTWDELEELLERGVMPFIFSDEDYESKLAEYMADSPIGISSSMKEDLFREQWEKDHAPITPKAHNQVRLKPSNR